MYHFFYFCITSLVWGESKIQSMTTKYYFSKYHYSNNMSKYMNLLGGPALIFFFLRCGQDAVGCFRKVFSSWQLLLIKTMNHYNLFQQSEVAYHIVYREWILNSVRFWPLHLRTTLTFQRERCFLPAWNKKRNFNRAESENPRSWRPSSGDNRARMYKWDRW